MARVTGKNGAVTFPSGINADFANWRLSFSHPVDDDTSYADTGAGASKSGCGTVDYSIGASGFLKSNAANTAPGFGGASAAVADADGASVTLTAHTGCTEVGQAILTGGAIDHAKRRGAIPVAYDGAIDGDLTESWATS